MKDSPIKCYELLSIIDDSTQRSVLYLGLELLVLLSLEYFKVAFLGVYVCRLLLKLEKGFLLFTELKDDLKLLLGYEGTRALFLFRLVDLIKRSYSTVSGLYQDGLVLDCFR